MFKNMLKTIKDSINNIAVATADAKGAPQVASNIGAGAGAVAGLPGASFLARTAFHAIPIPGLNLLAGAAVFVAVEVAMSTIMATSLYCIVDGVQYFVREYVDRYELKSVDGNVIVIKMDALKEEFKKQLEAGKAAVVAAAVKANPVGKAE